MGHSAAADATRYAFIVLSRLRVRLQKISIIIEHCSIVIASYCHLKGSGR